MHYQEFVEVITYILTDIPNCLIVLLIIFQTYFVYFSVTFDTCDNKPIYRVNDGKFYSVSFNGNNMPDNKCKLSFHAYDSDHTLNQYKICIQATYWNIQDDDLDLYYYTESGDAAKVTKL